MNDGLLREPIAIEKYEKKNNIIVKENNKNYIRSL